MEKVSDDFTLDEVISAYGDAGISFGQTKFTDGSGTIIGDNVCGHNETGKALEFTSDGGTVSDCYQLANEKITENHITPEFSGDMNAGRKRRKIAAKETWSVTINRRKRMQGDDYAAYKPCSGESRKMKKVIKPARTIGETCTSAKCSTSKTRNCSLFSVDDRKHLFDSFWKDMTWGQKRAYVLSMVDQHKVDRKTTMTNSRRGETFNYFLKLNFRHSDFLNFSMTERMFYASIRPGSKSGDPCVTDIRQLRYNPNGSIDYKLDHKAEWTCLPRKAKKLTPTFSRLYSSTIPITKRKYQDLMDLLHVIPNEYHSFYKNLPKNIK